MAGDERVVFLSLRPRFAELLLDGGKRVELRRIRPQADPGTLAVIYAASPVRAVLGTCVVEAIGAAAPDDIWRLHGPDTAITWRDFRDYFAGASRAVAITVVQPTRLPHPVPLAQLRGIWGGFQPPQSFRYVTMADVAEFIGGEATAASRSAGAL